MGAAVMALGKIRDRSAVPTLIRALDAPDKAIRYKAHDLLRRRTGEDFGLQRKHWEKWLKGAQGPRAKTR
jgi:HEAT repeat protein